MFCQDASLQQRLNPGVLDLDNLDRLRELVREVFRPAAENHQIWVVLERDMGVSLRFKVGDGLVFRLGHVREFHARPG